MTAQLRRELLTAGAHVSAEICGGLKRNMGVAGQKVPPRPSAVCSAHPGMPAHTLRCGLELSQEHSVERLDERDRVYSANRRPTVCLLCCLPALSRTKYTAAGVCARVRPVFLYGLHVCGVEGRFRMLSQSKTKCRWKPPPQKNNLKCMIVEQFHSFI